MWYLAKLLISAGLIVLVSEVSKRFSILGGLLASLPLVSYLGMIWLYIDTSHTQGASEAAQKVSDLSWSIFWLVFPSLSLFVALPLLLKVYSFVPSLILATLIMFAFYGTMLLVLYNFNIKV